MPASKTKSTPTSKSGLLDVLAQRWAEFLEKAPDTYKAPVFSPGADAMTRSALRLHAEANRSDPFAYARAAKDVKHGYVTIQELETDARNRIGAQH